MAGGIKRIRWIDNIVRSDMKSRCAGKYLPYLPYPRGGMPNSNKSAGIAQHMRWPLTHYGDRAADGSNRLESSLSPTALPDEYKLTCRIASEMNNAIIIVTYG